MSFDVKKDCGNPSCPMNGTLHGHWAEEANEVQEKQTEAGNTEQTEMQKKAVQRVTEFMRKHEHRFINAVLKGPGATVIALEEIIRDFEWFQEQALAQAVAQDRANLIALLLNGTEPPDCGDPDCPVHGTEAKAAAAAEQQTTDPDTGNSDL